MFESGRGVAILKGGLALCVVVYTAMGLSAWRSRAGGPERALDDAVVEGFVPEFVELAERFPDRFGSHFPQGVTVDSYREALTVGRAVYVAEGCWHCHTQQVRPIPYEMDRWGSATRGARFGIGPRMPSLRGTRRVGPDLSREGGLRSNDWHLAHFYKATNVSPTSVMPAYPWLFDEQGYPNKRGMALVTYVQWLGS